MDKLTIATQVLLKLIETDKTGFDAEGIAAYSFEIAEAMQAESEKREDKTRPDVLKSVDPKEYINAVLKNITEPCDHEWTHIKYFGAEGDFYVCPCGAKSERPHGF